MDTEREIDDDDVRYDIGPAAVAILHKLGYRARLTEVGDSIHITSSAGGFPFSIGYVPIETLETEWYTFLAHFEVILPLEQINAWNASANIARAYIDDQGETMLQLMLPKEGLTRASFTAHLMEYISAVEKFGLIARASGVGLRHG